MRNCLILFFAGTAALMAGQAAEESGPVAVVHQLFRAMSSHNADAARAAFTPEATLLSVQPNGTISTMTAEQFATHVGAATESWLEEISAPKVLMHGAIAVVWADYEFHLNGKLHHCGVDSMSLVKTPEGWKIAGVVYTTQTSGCGANAAQ